MARSEDVKSPPAIISFSADLFEARTKDNGGKQFGCTLLFPKGTSLAALEKAAAEAAVAEWGDKAIQWIKDEVIKSPFLDGDGKQAVSKKTGERHPGYAGHKFIRCTSGEKYPPKVFGRKGSSQPIFSASDVPSGSTVFAVVNAFTWENKENGKGLTFGISIVQVITKAEGDAILGGGGGADPDKWLETIADEGDAPDATKGGAGAGGLFG